jgi:zinc protease
MNINRSIAPEIKDIATFNIVKAEKQLLANNIPLYLLNTGNNELVKIEWIFSAGNWYQPAPLVAFTVNSMLQEGTQKYSSQQIAELVEYYGAHISYSLDKDNAFVTLVCMHKYLAEVLEIVADIIMNAVFPEHELVIFRNKHKQQFLVEQSMVKNVARYVHMRMLFGNSHPYGYMVTLDDFDRLNRDEMKKFHKTCYQAKYCQIIAAGKADDQVLKIIEKQFGSWQSTQAQLPESFTIHTEAEREQYINKPDAVQSAVRIGKVLMNKLHEDFVPMSVLTCILGGYMGSRLMKKIREEKGYTYGINSILVTFKNAGYLTIVSELGAHVTAQGISDIYAEIDKLRNEPVTDEELTRVKNYILGDVARMFDGPFAQADSLITLLEYNLNYDYVPKMIDTIKHVSKSQMQDFAIKYLDPATFSQAVVGIM